MNRFIATNLTKLYILASIVLTIASGAIGVATIGGNGAFIAIGVWIFTMGTPIFLFTRFQKKATVVAPLEPEASHIKSIETIALT